MSEEQFKAFMEKVKSDTILQEKLKVAANPDAVLAIAREAGFEVSDDDLTKELTEAELEGVAGGGSYMQGGCGDGSCQKDCRASTYCTVNW
ncbi:Nif11-like leader peptide family natural product precursor [Synechococcus sp. BIOS-E4-1]|uniref:Nif11-like leader peptide family natural product precursor n=1 Tax=Synechococcus sp. BIOS-E4-1 TaxID=1400864 RepID=UPI0016478447|nr:Nif11-like leader peptide family natural product precursor [Synechococcus sp. BIOS-E4-1]